MAAAIDARHNQCNRCPEHTLHIQHWLELRFHFQVELKEEGAHRISNVECLQLLIHQYVRRTTWLQQVGQRDHIHSLLQWGQFLLWREQYLPWFANVVEQDARRRGFHRARIVDETKRFVVHCIQPLRKRTSHTCFNRCVFREVANPRSRIGADFELV